MYRKRTRRERPYGQTMSIVDAHETDDNAALSDEQIAFYDANGYLVLRDRVPAPLLRKLRAAGDRWITAGAGRDNDDPANADFHFKGGPDVRTMFRVDYLHDKGEPVSLELLGAPCILGIAAGLAAPNFVPTYESMVFKAEGDGAAIEWHQDAVHPRKHRIFNVDIYLDDSVAGAGALRVVPGSHRRKQDICAIEEDGGWAPEGVTEVEMAPGDVLIHDVMLVHGSPPVSGNALRRTIYYEFRAAEQILSEGPWDRDWVDRRLRLLPLALDAHARAFPEAPQYSWQIDPSLRPPAPDGDDLRVLHVVGTAGSYCSAGSV